jgi:hypothetical protein
MTRRVAIAVSLSVAALGLANLVCAIIFGAVRTNYSSEWLYFHNAPIGFLAAVAFSLIAFVGLSALSVLMMVSARDERRYWAKVSSLAPTEESPKASSKRPG